MFLLTLTKDTGLIIDEVFIALCILILMNINEQNCYSAKVVLIDGKESYYQQLAIYEKEEIDEKGTPVFLTEDQLKDILYQYNYVILFHPNDVFACSYGDLFEEKREIEDGTVFKVATDNGEMKLQFVGKMGIKAYK